jgi:hypothetical protein
MVTPLPVVPAPTPVLPLVPAPAPVVPPLVGPVTTVPEQAAKASTHTMLAANPFAMSPPEIRYVTERPGAQLLMSTELAA